MANQNSTTSFKQVEDFSKMVTVQLGEFKIELAALTVDPFAIKDLGELGSKDTELQHHARELESNFSVTETRALAFISRVEAIIKYCNNDEIVKMQEVTKGNLRHVKNYLEELKPKVEDCKKSYQLFNKNRQEVQTSSTKAAKKCNEKAEEADAKKTKHKL